MLSAPQQGIDVSSLPYYKEARNALANEKWNGKPSAAVDSNYVDALEWISDISGAEGMADLFGLPKISSPAASHKIRPNDPCPCGSGKKYKKCHGRM